MNLLYNIIQPDEPLLPYPNNQVVDLEKPDVNVR